MGQTAIWLISTKMLKLILWWLLLCCMLWHPSPWKSMLKSPSTVSRFLSARTSQKEMIPVLDPELVSSFHFFQLFGQGNDKRRTKQRGTIDEQQKKRPVF